MKKQTNDLRDDVSELVEKVTVEEAHQTVFKKLETAFASLDSKSQEVLHAYFNGTSLEELSQLNAISVNETRDWISQIKRQLISQLQRSTSTRN